MRYLLVGLNCKWYENETKEESKRKGNHSKQGLISGLASYSL